VGTVADRDREGGGGRRGRERQTKERGDDGQREGGWTNGRPYRTEAVCCMRAGSSDRVRTRGGTAHGVCQHHTGQAGIRIRAPVPWFDLGRRPGEFNSPTATRRRGDQSTHPGVEWGWAGKQAPLGYLCPSYGPKRNSDLRVGDAAQAKQQCVTVSRVGLHPTFLVAPGSAVLSLLIIIFSM
jgi:hypothetical protein